MQTQQDKFHITEEPSETNSSQKPANPLDQSPKPPEAQQKVTHDHTSPPESGDSLNEKAVWGGADQKLAEHPLMSQAQAEQKAIDIFDDSNGEEYSDDNFD